MTPTLPPLSALLLLLLLLGLARLKWQVIPRRHFYDHFKTFSCFLAFLFTFQTSGGRKEGLRVRKNTKMTHQAHFVQFEISSLNIFTFPLPFSSSGLCGQTKRVGVIYFLPLSLFLSRAQLLLLVIYPEKSHVPIITKLPFPRFRCACIYLLRFANSRKLFLK